jgi:predicted transcriptional regulator
VQALVLKLLNEYGLTQGQIDRATGIQQSRVSRYARGKVPSGLDDVFKLIELERRLAREAKAKEPAPH